MTTNLPLATFLQNELTNLANESRKKNPEIKDAAERVLLQIRVAKDSSVMPSPTVIGSGRAGVDPLSVELSKSSDTLEPFFMSLDTRNPKLASIATLCLQRLLAQQAVAPRSVGKVLKYISENAKDQQEQQIKLLQLAVSVITAYGIHDEAVFDTLMLCYRLSESKSAVVSNTAAATLRQLAVIVFDKAALEQQRLQRQAKQTPVEADVADQESQLTSRGSEEEADNPALDEDLANLGNGTHAKNARVSTEALANELPPFQRDAFLLLEDLCRLTGGEHGLHMQCLKFKRNLGFDVLEGIVLNHQALLKQAPQLSALLKRSFCPLILKLISEQSEFSATLHLVRLVSLLVKFFHAELSVECEIFLTMFSKVLEMDSTPLWHRVILLETFKSFVSDESLVMSLFKTFDAQQQASNVLRDMITTFYKALMSERVLTLIQPSQRDSALPAELPVLEQSKILHIDQLDKSEPPAVADGYFAYLAISCVLTVSLSISSQTSPNEEDLKVHYALLGSSYAGILSCYSFLLSALLTETMFQQVLSSCEKFSIALNMLPRERSAGETATTEEQAAPRDAFLYCLCRVAVPSSLLSEDAMQFEKLKDNNLLQQPSVKQTGRSSIPILSENLKALSTAVVSPAIVLTERQVWTCHAILRLVASPSPEILDMKTWYLVMDTLQIAEFLIRFNKVAPLPTKPATLTGGLSNAASALMGSAAGALANLSGRSYETAAAQPVGANNGTLSASLDASYVQLVVAIRKSFETNSRQMQFDALEQFLRALCLLAVDHSSSNLTSLLSNKNGASGSTAAPGAAGSLNNSEREKSFALSKLFEVVMSNMGRLVAPELQLKASQVSTVGQERGKLWVHICDTVISIAHYEDTLSPIRKQAVSLLSDMLIAGAQIKHEAVELRVLNALYQFVRVSWCSTNSRADYVYKLGVSGLETLDNVLQCGGQHFKQGWDLIFTMIKSVVTLTSVPDASLKLLVKAAFPSLQLIVADFLSLLNDGNVNLCLETALAFGKQTADLNIALTAVGFVWKISDNVIKHRAQFTAPVADRLWMKSLDSLVALADDGRSDLRNSAVQTLFRTISLNGDQLSLSLWDECIVRVLFALLQVTMARSAKLPEATVDRESTSIMVHHSRDTPAKLLDETKVLAIAGVAKAIQDRLAFPEERLLPAEETAFSDKFFEIWKTFIDFLKRWILSNSVEVSLNTSKCFRQVLQVLSKACSQPSAEAHAGNLWKEAWTCWNETVDEIFACSTTVDVPLSREAEYLFSECAITNFFEQSKLEGVLADDNAQCLITQKPLRILVGSHFTLEILTQLVLVVGDILPYVRSQLCSIEQLNALQLKVETILLYHKSNSADDAAAKKYSMQESDEIKLTPLQTSVFSGLYESGLLRNAFGDGVDSKDVIGALVVQWCRMIQWPLLAKDSLAGKVDSKLAEVDICTYVSLAKRLAVLIGCAIAKEPSLRAEQRLIDYAIEGLGWPMQFKYAFCGGTSTNGAGVQSFCRSSATALFEMCFETLEKLSSASYSSALKSSALARLVWVIDGFLLPVTSAPTGISVDDIESDEALDLKWLDLIQNRLLMSMVDDGVPALIPSRLLATVLRGSKLYLSHEELGAQNVAARQLGANIAYADRARLERDKERNRTLVGTTLASDVVPVLRERFAASCLNMLFRLCSASSPEPMQKRFKMAKITFPVLLKRCRGVLLDYICDKPIFGRCPLPRMRSDELNYILSNLVHLSLLPGIAYDDAKESSGTAESPQSVVHSAILSGQSAHLFLLYSLFVECLGLGGDSTSASLNGTFTPTAEEPAQGALSNTTSTNGSIGSDEAVIEMFKACLRRIGKELGLDSL